MANVIAAWAERYLDKPEVMTEAEVEAGLVLVRETHGGKFQQEILTGPHRLLADEPVKLGGLDSGPGPYDFLLAGLGACTAMTIRLYADFKKIPLANVSVRLNHEKKIHTKDCEDCADKVTKVDHIERAITLEGPLDAAQRSEADGNRRQMPGAPDAGVENRHPHRRAAGVSNTTARFPRKRATNRNAAGLPLLRIDARKSYFPPPCIPPRPR